MIDWKRFTRRTGGIEALIQVIEGLIRKGRRADKGLFLLLFLYCRRFIFSPLLLPYTLTSPKCGYARSKKQCSAVPLKISLSSVMRMRGTKETIKRKV